MLLTVCLVYTRRLIVGDEQPPRHCQRAANLSRFHFKTRWTLNLLFTLSFPQLPADTMSSSRRCDQVQIEFNGLNIVDLID